MAEGVLVVRFVDLGKRDSSHEGRGCLQPLKEKRFYPKGKNYSQTMSKHNIREDRV
jgi:hypothetical protein